MKIRGERECQSCGTRWSYYETGSVVCPDCGSMRSVGLDDPSEHTASPVTLDLTEIRGVVDDRPLGDIAETASESCREYVRKRGFISRFNCRLPSNSRLIATFEDSTHPSVDIFMHIRQ